MITLIFIVRERAAVNADQIGFVQSAGLCDGAQIGDHIAGHAWPHQFDAGRNFVGDPPRGLEEFCVLNRALHARLEAVPLVVERFVPDFVVVDFAFVMGEHLPECLLPALDIRLAEPF